MRDMKGESLPDLVPVAVALARPERLPADIARTSAAVLLWARSSFVPQPSPSTHTQVSTDTIVQ